ncbi:MAG TPA: transposase [Ktedonobacteraceae bacterium]|jgi:IS5 family transposase
MLIDRHPQEEIFERVPQMAARIDPALRRLDALLDDDEWYQAVRADLCRRHPRTLTVGRPSTPAEALLRMLLLKHAHGWSFQETEDQVDQSLVLRWFCRLFWQRTPDDSTLIRWAKILRPGTLHRLVERTADLARQAKVTQGRKLRTDGMCMQTDIHHPTDSGLLVDRVRGLSRLVRQARGLRQAEGARVQQRCRSRLRTARRAAQAIHRQLRRKGEEKETEQKKQEQRLVETNEQMVQQVVQHLCQRSEALATRLVARAQGLLPLVEQVISQTRRRVFQGEKVPSDEKVLSLVEPHTRAVLRHKAGNTVEFGRQVEPGVRGRRDHHALQDAGASDGTRAGRHGGGAPRGPLRPSAGVAIERTTRENTLGMRWP